MKKIFLVVKKNIFFHENNSQDLSLRYLASKREGYFYSLVNTVLTNFIGIIHSHYPH
jgi:hypothetical protein